MGWGVNMDIYTPTKFRQEIYAILKDINNNNKTVTITKANGNDEDSAVVISKKDWEAYQETMALLANGQLQAAIQAENEPGGIDIDDLIKETDAEDAAK